MLVGIQDEILRLHSMGLLGQLLADRTTRTNIIWATDAYLEQGADYQRDKEIEESLITGQHSDVIKTRARKAMEQQSERTRKHAEVFTPLWICRKMVSHGDAVWFGRHDPFLEGEQPTEQVLFPKRRKWQHYVDARRLEITCGEAPFLVNRYDVATGEEIPLEYRAGVLDRKLRVVNENAADEAEWLEWAQRAYQATYGYEFQGDNLLIARVNLLMTYEEYLFERWKRKPTASEYKKIVDAICWNIWQMDGLSGTLPYCKAPEEVRQISLFEWLGSEEYQEKVGQQPRCKIKNWRQNNLKEFVEVNQDKGGKKNMKFDFVIGNPPYQDERQGESTTALPIYHSFLEAAYKVSCVTELITPARFLFNAGRTPKAWNEKMLGDPHLKVLMYEQDASKIFSNTDIKGGVAITYRDETKQFGAIDTFTIFNEANSIINKVKPMVRDKGTFATLMFVASKFNTLNLFQDYPQYKGHERRMSSNVLEFECFHDLFDSNKDIAVYGIYKGKRTQRFIDRKYVDLTDENVAKYKIVTPKADGNGHFGDTLTNPQIQDVNTGFTHTFLGIGGFNSVKEAENALKYVKTKFARALLSVLKVTQDLNADKWKYVPLQDFTSSSDIDWSKSIAEIDRQLYAKYGLDEKEIAFIESHVKEMA